MEKEKTYTEKVHYKFIIEGDYVIDDALEEDLHENAEDMHDLVLDYLGCQDMNTLFNENGIKKIFSDHEIIPNE